MMMIYMPIYWGHVTVHNDIQCIQCIGLGLGLVRYTVYTVYIVVDCNSYYLQVQSSSPMLHDSLTKTSVLR